MKCQTEKNKLYDFTHAQNIKISKWINEQAKPNKNKHIDTEDRVVVTKVKGEVNSIVTNGIYFGGELSVV